jgi:amino acid adenylation domain-containing protein
VRGPEIYFKAGLFESLKKVANSSGVPIRTVLLAAHIRALSYLTDQTDMITGLVTNGRPQVVDGDRLIGLFLNTLPVRVDCSGGTWRDLIQATFRAEREVLPHRRTPLAQVQNLTGNRALFETAFDFVQFHVYRDLPGYGERAFVEDHYFEANNFPFFVTFMVDVTGTELQMHYDYDPNEFCEEQIASICEYYSAALAAIAADVDARYEKAPLLPASEKQRLLVDWNATESAYNKTACVHQLFEQQVERTPDAVAVVFENQQLTYRQLNDWSNAVAVRLAALGAGREMLVGVAFERSVEMLVAVLGVMKAGAAYVPLDPKFPVERLKFMSTDAGLKILVTQSHLKTDWCPQDCVRLFVEEVNREAGRNTTLPNVVRACDLAYTIYTSGSTGQPKGVQLSHGAVVNLLTAMQREPGIRSSDTLLAVTTLSFDIAGLELYLPLTVGAKIVIAGSAVTSDPLALSRLLHDSQATIMQATPTTWRMLLESGWTGNIGLKVLCGGEAMSRELANALIECCDSVWNMYGPTETTIWSCVYRVGPGTGPVPIGKPIANTQVYILDSRLNPVPVGSDGELYIAGDGLAVGYLKRPDLTADRFVLNPFVSGSASRMYKTGDIARYVPDGNLVCVGRVDHQVKIHGFRIELGEIESALRRTGLVAECVVVDREIQGEKKLVAYVQPSAGDQEADVSACRDALKVHLPQQMIPHVFVSLPRLPLTPNGKIDRGALPKPDINQGSTRSFVAPETPVEKEIAAIWSDVLGVGRVGLNDNFFELGGHSLLAMRVLARLRENIGLEITIASLFENPKLNDFCVVVLQALVAESERLEAAQEASVPTAKI